MKAEEDCEELLGLFNEHRVRYCIVGAFAVGLHAMPRYTKDMDIFVDPAPGNGRRIMDALDEFGFGGLGLSERGLLPEGGHHPAGI